MKRRLSLRNRVLTRILPVALALLALVGVLTEKRVDSELRSQIQQQVNARAEALAAVTESRLQQAVDACAALSINDIVVNGVVDVEHRKGALQSFVRSLEMPGADVNNVVLTDFQGVPIALKNRSQYSLGRQDPTWLNTVMAGAPYLAIEDDELLVAYPVFFEDRPQAGLLAKYHVDDFFANHVTADNRDVVYCYMFEGRMIACSSPNATGEALEERVQDGWSTTDVPIQLIPGLQLVVCQSDSMATRAVGAVRMALWLAAFTISITLIAGIWLTARYVTRPLIEFNRTIQDVRAHADLTKRVVTSDIREFASLGSQFNDMLVQLEKTTVSKEQSRIPALVAKYTDNAVTVANAQGQIEWVNEAFERCTGYALDDVSGKQAWVILSGPESDADVLQRIDDAIRQSRGIDTELLCYRKSGETFWVAMEIRPILQVETGEVEKYIFIERDITERKVAQIERDTMSKQMMDLSRRAGMAEIATGVLHNVGNVLNSLNVSSTLVAERIEKSAVSTLERVTGLLAEHSNDLEAFLASPQGERIPTLLGELAKVLQDERNANLQELQSLAADVEHIRQIVRTQQQHARATSACEKLDMSELLAEALRIRTHQLSRHNIHVEQHYESVPPVETERHLVIQILVNLVGNAADALASSQADPRRIVLRLNQESESIRLEISDNGIGIDSENLVKIFSHGFTTRSDGHGFGLHSCALAARQLGGSLSAASPGLGQGATFTLRLPVGVAEDVTA